MLVDYTRKASLIGALLQYSVLINPAQSASCTRFWSDLVLDTGRTPSSFQFCRQKTQHYLLHGLENLLPQIQRHFCQLEEAFPALNPNVTGEAGSRNGSFQDRAVLRKHHLSHSFSVIQVRVISEVTILWLSSLPDSQWLPHLQQRHIQLLSCP